MNDVIPADYNVQPAEPHTDANDVTPTGNAKSADDTTRQKILPTVATDTVVAADSEKSTTDLVAADDVIPANDETLPNDVSPASSDDQATTGVANSDQPATSSDDKMIDTHNPIQLGDDTVIMIKGKRCVLRIDPDTGAPVAFPLVGNSMFLHLYWCFPTGDVRSVVDLQ